VHDMRPSRRTTSEWLEQLGSGLRRRRIRADITQEDLAREAGVSVSALKHLESGRGANLTSFVKVLRALGGEDWLDSLVEPVEPAVSPIQLLRERQRGRRGRQRVHRA
jgi:transcriptional regulator with XRE-family HTH domain